MAVPKELNPLEEEEEEEEEEEAESCTQEPLVILDRSQRQFYAGSTSLDEEIKTTRFDGNEEEADQNTAPHRMPPPSSLSLEALTLLQSASRSVMKKKRVQRGSYMGRTVRSQAVKVGVVGSATVMARKANRNAPAVTGKARMVAAKGTHDDGPADDYLLLLQELHYLRSLLPSHYVNTSHGDLDSESCVVKDALSYLKFLKEELHNIKDGLNKNSKTKASTEVVERNVLAGPKLEMNFIAGPKLEVKLSCQKRVGILGDIMAALEAHGLVFDKVDASCHPHLLLHAISSQEGVHLVDKQALRKALWVAISRR